MNTPKKILAYPPPHPSFRSSRACSPPISREKNARSPDEYFILARKQPKCQVLNSLNDQMLDVLKTENMNLKQQNEFLIDKLRLSSENQTYYRQKYLKYSDLVEQLKEHNLLLQKEMENLRSLATSQILKLTGKNNQLSRAKSASNLAGEEQKQDYMFDIEQMNPEFSKDQTSTQALSDKATKQPSSVVRKLIERSSLRLRKKKSC